MSTRRLFSPTPRVLRAICVLSAVLASSALAAQSRPILEGSRVRLTVPGHPLDGRVALLDGIQDDAVTVRPLLDTAESVRIERRRISRIEMWEGRHGNALRGMVIGAGAGALGGAIAGLASGDGFIFTKEEAAGMGALLFGAAGAVGGLMIGATIMTDRWTEAELGGASLSIQPTVDGSRPGVRVRIPLGTR